MQFTVKMGGQTNQHQMKDRANGLAIVMLGAFDGKAGSGDTPIEGSPTVHPVDLDTLDIRMEKLQPSISLCLEHQAGLSKIDLNFSNLDDFHPDRLLEQLAAHTSTTYGDPEVFDDQPAAKLPPMSRGPTDTESERDTLSRLLGERPLSVEQNKTGGSNLSAAKKSMIEEVVQRIAQHASGEQDTQRAESQTNGARENHNQTKLLRTLLHAKAFQGLESSWRAVDWLIHTTEPDPAVRFYILNMSRDKLERERADHEKPTTSPLYDMLLDLQARDDLFGSELYLLDQHQYGLAPEDIATLEWLGSLLGSLDGSLLAAADSSFMNAEVESDDLIELWQNFRQRTPSQRVALLYPQVLLRLPYGSQTDPIQSVEFDELNDRWTVDDLLWGNPAYAAVILMIRRWSEQPDSDSPVLLTDLPVYSYQRDGEYQLQPCTKTLLKESEIDQLLKLGLVPVIGSRSSNAIKIPWYQHIGSTTSQ
jgi:predicted component of type VI protein secretion system